MMSSLFGAAAEEEQALPSEAPVLETANPDAAGEAGTEPPAGEAAEETPAPTEAPTPEPTEAPTPEPTEAPTPEPTEIPTPEPTEAPTPEPTEVPTPEPTEAPTPEPTEVPTPEPTEAPTPEPTEVPTPVPTEVPTPEPTEAPTPEPTATAAPTEAVIINGILQIGSPYQAALKQADRQTLQLTLAEKMELVLQAGGIPVKITILNVKSGWQRIVQTNATKDIAETETAAVLELPRGEYHVVVEPLKEGRVWLSFAEPVTEEAPEETVEAVEAAETVEAAVEAEPEIAEETTAAEEAGEPEETEADEEAEAVEEAAVPEPAPADETEPAETEEPSDAAVTAEAAEAQETAAEQESSEAEPEETFAAVIEEMAAPEATPAQPLTVTITVSCEGPYAPGSVVTLRAQVSDDAYQGEIRWQYSADGGLTVCDVENAEGAEYSFRLDEANSTWWWRAYVK